MRNTFLINSHIIERCSIDLCGRERAASQVHMVWRSQDKHPAAEGQQGHHHLLIQSTQLKAHCENYILSNVTCVHCQGKTKFKKASYKDFLESEKKMTERPTWQWDQPACMHKLHKHHSRNSLHAYKQKQITRWWRWELLQCWDWIFIDAHGAMIARAGLLVDCALESQSSNCAFSWDPKNRSNKLTLNHKGPCTPTGLEITNNLFACLTIICLFLSFVLFW